MRTPKVLYPDGRTIYKPELAACLQTVQERAHEQEPIDRVLLDKQTRQFPGKTHFIDRHSRIQQVQLPTPASHFDASHHMRRELVSLGGTVWVGFEDQADILQRQRVGRGGFLGDVTDLPATAKTRWRVSAPTPGLSRRTSETVDRDTPLCSAILVIVARSLDGTTLSWSCSRSSLEL